MPSLDNKETVRLNRYMAILGLGSRRACEDIIAGGKVTVDGRIVLSPSFKVIPGISNIKLGGKKLDHSPKKIILLMNKPEGIVTTVSDPHGRKTVIDICRKHNFRMRLFPVGRLDLNSSGAILLTNDGLLCYRLIHPKFQIHKVYYVRTRGRILDKKLARMRRLAQPSLKTAERGLKTPRIELIKDLGKENLLKIVLYEGKNRQVRKLCDDVGLKVVKLKRVVFGPLSIRSLSVGSIRPLTKKEIAEINKIAAWEDDEK